MVFVEKSPFFQFFFLGAIGQENVFYVILKQKKTPFQAIKTKSSRSRKTDIFPKGIAHGCWSKNGHFSNIFFLGNMGKEMSVTILQNQKSPFKTIKTRRSKSPRIDFFTKGLTHGFGQKMTIFPTFFFQLIQARKMSFTIFQNEKSLFKTIKTTHSKSRKIDIFPKGLTHGFGPKMAIFPTFLFQAIQARIMSFTIFYNGKGPFWAIKTRSSKSGKIDIFQKGLTHGFVPKMAILPTFFFRQYRLEKYLLRYSRTKNRLSRL